MQLKELSKEYEMVKWSVIGKVMDIEKEKCKLITYKMELFWFE